MGSQGDRLNAPLTLSHSRGVGGAFSMSTDDMRKSANGTSNGERMDNAVTAVAHSRVRVPRPATLLFQPYRVTEGWR